MTECVWFYLQHRYLRQTGSNFLHLHFIRFWCHKNNHDRMNLACQSEAVIIQSPLLWVYRKLKAGPLFSSICDSLELSGQRRIQINLNIFRGNPLKGPTGQTSKPQVGSNGSWRTDGRMRVCEWVGKGVKKVSEYIPTGMRLGDRTMWLSALQQSPGVAAVAISRTRANIQLSITSSQTWAINTSCQLSLCTLIKTHL